MGVILCCFESGPGHPSKKETRQTAGFLLNDYSELIFESLWVHKQEETLCCISSHSVT